MKKYLTLLTVHFKTVPVPVVLYLFKNSVTSQKRVSSPKYLENLLYSILSGWNSSTQYLVLRPKFLLLLSTGTGIF